MIVCRPIWKESATLSAYCRSSEPWAGRGGRSERTAESCRSKTKSLQQSYKNAILQHGHDVFCVKLTSLTMTIAWQ